MQGFPQPKKLAKGFYSSSGRISKNWSILCCPHVAHDVRRHETQLYRLPSWSTPLDSITRGSPSYFVRSVDPHILQCVNLPGTTSRSLFLAPAGRPRFRVVVRFGFAFVDFFFAIRDAPFTS